MTSEQREILLHTLGMNTTPRGKPYRNYYNVGLSGKDFDNCVALEESGLMKRGRQIDGPSVYFHATAEGVQRAVGLLVPRADIEEWLKTDQWPKRRRSR